MTNAPLALHVRRDDLRVASPTPLELPPLAEGQARFRVERFALTANNVTYAAHGDDLGYWRFYPAPEGFGIVPVWGFGTVEESRVEGLARGDRFYGYWPTATHAVLTPVRVSARGFADGGAHRAELAPVYNGYQRWSGGDEAVQALFRPLYTTAFLLADQIAGDGAAPAAVVMSSASSKTALGLGFALRDAGVRRIGLTSAANRAFTERTGAYDEVATYEAIETLDAPSAAFVDFAGNGAVRRAVHTRFGDRLTASIVVGDTHWDAAPGGEALPGARPEFFFAPTRLAQRMADWGPAEFERRLGGSWAGFVDFARGWLKVSEAHGAGAVADAWRRMASGDVDPSEGLMLSMHD